MARKIIDQYSFRFKKNVDPRVKLFPLLQDNLNDTITYLIEKEIAENGLRNLQMFIPGRRNLLGPIEKDLANLSQEELELYKNIIGVNAPIGEVEEINKPKNNIVKHEIAQEENEPIKPVEHLYKNDKKEVQKEEKVEIIEKPPVVTTEEVVSKEKELEIPKEYYDF